MAETPDLPAWPALEMPAGALPRELVYSRAVWGKVHGAASDFRWIASGAAFDLDARLETRLALGSEDAPASGQAWSSLNGRACAVGFYPSRARDAAGRSGFLEKQVWLWQRPVELPAVLGALLLLPLAVEAGDEVWWERRAEPRLHDPDFRLELSAELEKPIPVDAERLAVRLESGRRRLVEAVSEPVLAEIYAALLAGCRTIPLAVSEPLAPEALGALLLPLPRASADRLSLTGWLPSSRSDAAELAERWSVVATDRPAELTAIGPRPSAAQVREGRSMAQALHAGRPSTSVAPSVAVPRAVSGEEVQIALWGPAAAGKTVLLAQLGLGRSVGWEQTGWEIFPTESSIKFGTDMRNLVTGQNRFPTATAAGSTDRLVYRFHKPETGARASLHVEDRAGAHSEKLDDHARQRLSAADGLVLVFDPHRDPARFQVEIEQTLDEVHIARRADVFRDDRPVAACISKADLLIKTAADARFAAEEPDTFVRERVAAVDRLVAALARFYNNYRLFPVSAAGLRLYHGAVEPTVFYDENLVLRIRGQSSPFNLMAPFAWVLDQVTAR